MKFWDIREGLRKRELRFNVPMSTDKILWNIHREMPRTSLRQ